MQVIRRTGSGREFVKPYEAAALKDVVYLGRNEEVEVLADFAPWNGLYIFHCHNMVHEDHDIIAAFDVTQVDLSKYGYSPTIDFSDPLSELFSAKPYSGTNINQVRDVLLAYYQSLNAYPDEKLILAALNEINRSGPQPAPATPPSITRSSAVGVPSTLTTSIRPTTTLRSGSGNGNSSSGNGNGGSGNGNGSSSNGNGNSSSSNGNNRNGNSGSGSGSGNNARTTTTARATRATRA